MGTHDRNSDTIESRVRKTITFDLYGCLLNDRLIQHFVGQVAREHGIEASLAENFYNLYVERVKFSSERFIPYYDLLQKVLLYVDMELNTKTIFVSHLDELFLMHIDIKPHVDVLPVLHHLADSGYELYLIANTSYQLVQRQFDNFDGLFHDKNICVTDEVKTYKPNHEFFRFAAKKFKLFGTDHFHVSSDYFNDIIPATQLHWDTMYVNRNKTGVHQDYEPTLILNNLNDLEEGMGYVRHRQQEEEFAAKKREDEAKEAAEAAQRAKLIKERQQYEQKKRAEEYALSQARKSPAELINNDEEFNILLKNVNPQKARALMLARQRALSNARVRNDLDRF